MLRRRFTAPQYSTDSYGEFKKCLVISLSVCCTHDGCSASAAVALDALARYVRRDTRGAARTRRGHAVDLRFDASAVFAVGGGKFCLLIGCLFGVDLQWSAFLQLPVCAGEVCESKIFVVCELWVDEQTDEDVDGAPANAKQR